MCQWSLISLYIVRMENQRSDLDTLPRALVLRLLVHKRAMRRPPCSPIQLGIEALNQQHLFRRLLPEIEPAMVSIRPNGKSLPNAVRIDQLHGQKVVFGHGRGVGDPERVFADGFDGPPDVDNLVAAFEEAVGVGGEVVLDALGAGFVGLVDVDALDGAAEGFGGVGGALIGGLAADGVVEDEDLGGAGALVGRNNVSIRKLGLSLEHWSV